MSTLQTWEITVGDTLTPIAATLIHLTDDGEEAVNLTGLTVRFTLVKEGSGGAITTVIGETVTGVTVVDASHGMVQFAFTSVQSLALDASYLYYFWFTVEGSGGKKDHYPVDDKKAQLNVYPKRHS